MTTTFKFRRGTDVRWAAVNPVLHDGEPGVEINTGKMKIGDGTHRWNDLDYFLPEAWIQEMIDAIVATGVPGPEGPEGPQGPPGADGADGDDGAQGLQGIPGTPGADGADGAQGPKGDDGDSAYQVAVNNGFVGTEAAWILSLKGDTGATGPEGPPGTDGADGATGPEGPQGDPGADGADYTGPNITSSSTAPSSPATGDIWVDLSA